MIMVHYENPQQPIVIVGDFTLGFDFVHFPYPGILEMNITMSTSISILIARFLSTLAYICIYTYTETYVHIYIYIYIYIDTNTYIYLYIQSVYIYIL